jgi:hypothetical protein
VWLNLRHSSMLSSFSTERCGLGPIKLIHVGGKADYCVQL